MSGMASWICRVLTVSGFFMVFHGPTPHGDGEGRLGIAPMAVLTFPSGLCAQALMKYEIDSFGTISTKLTVFRLGFFAAGAVCFTFSLAGWRVWPGMIPVALMAVSVPGAPALSFCGAGGTHMTSSTRS